MLNSVNIRADDEIDTHMKSEYQDQEAGMVENSWPLHLPLLYAAAVFFTFPANIRSFWDRQCSQAAAQCGAMRQLPSKSPPPILTSTPLYCPLLSPLTLHSLLLYSTRPRLYSVIRTEDLHPYMYIVLFWRQLPRPSAVTSHARNITIRQMLARRGDTKVHLDTHPRRGVRMYFDVQHRGTRSVGFCSTAGHMLRVNNALFPRPTHNTC